MSFIKRIAFLLFAIGILSSCQEKKPKYIQDSGFVFGTAYNFRYQYDKSLNNEIRQVLDMYDNSLSTFNTNSTVSKINRNEHHQVDSFFTTVWNKAMEMNALSDGVFDVTIRGLSSHWRFAKGFLLDTISTEVYDSLVAGAKDVLPLIGMDKIRLQGDSIVKDDPRIQIDMNALAEGYGIDVAAMTLEKFGVQNYMVEIGGELHLKGLSPSGSKWRIGIDSPSEDNNIFERQAQHIIEVTDCAISTSGSYRQFYYTADGKRISHTINPKTGFPIEHKTLSVTVIGPNTMTTDAMATIFMVIGHEKAIEMANSIDGIETLIIYENDDKEQVEVMTDGFRQVMVR
ncbi:MAG: FAD:protein FMN transferase [Bacteroidales bacterium]|nr:FAD:protein FMN transferase [Bacteroidales bacterium]